MGCIAAHPEFSIAEGQIAHYALAEAPLPHSALSMPVSVFLLPKPTYMLLPVDQQMIVVQAKSEIYVGKLRQQLRFLPGLPWLQLGSWKLPESLVQALATCIRRTARLLWTVHLSFQEGFDEVSRSCFCGSAAAWLMWWTACCMQLLAQVNLMSSHLEIRQCMCCLYDQEL